MALNEAVAEGKMTEKAAELFMKKLFKVDDKEAAELIDVPDATIEQGVDTVKNKGVEKGQSNDAE